MSYMKRVLEERTELADKVKKLSDFLATPAADAIDRKPWVLLVRQRQVMEMYLDILDERILSFTEYKK